MGETIQSCESHHYRFLWQRNTISALRECESSCLIVDVTSMKG